MNIILKTITRTVGGLKLYSAEKVNDIDLTGFTLEKEIKFKHYRIFVYKNSLIADHTVTLEIFQVDVENQFQRNIVKLQENISHGKVGWTSLGRDLKSILAGNPYL